MAPSRDLFSVPSSSIIVLSMKRLLGRVEAEDRLADLGVDVLDRLQHALAEIARGVAVAQARWPPSSPVDAPEGTAARPDTPDSSTTSASMVGLPRESRISRAMTSTMALMFRDQESVDRDQLRSSKAGVAGAPPERGKRGFIGAHQLGLGKPSALHRGVELDAAFPAARAFDRAATHSGRRTAPSPDRDGFP